MIYCYKKHLQGATFSYWIEKSILSSIRYEIFDKLYQSASLGKSSQGIKEIKEIITDEYLRNLIKSK